MMEDESLETDFVDDGPRRSRPGRKANDARHRRLQNQWTLPEGNNVVQEIEPEEVADRQKKKKRSKPRAEKDGDTREEPPPNTADAWGVDETAEPKEKPRRRRGRKGEKSSAKEAFSSVARCRNMDVQITLADEGILWSSMETAAGRRCDNYTLPYERVLRTSPGESNGTFVLRYADISGKYLRLKSMELLVGEEAIAKKWVKYTSKIIAGLFSRPRSARVYLHMAAGRGNAGSMFKVNGFPRLRELDIDADITEVTTAQDFIDDVSSLEKLTEYDGLLVVGNQQSFRFLLNAVMQRVHSDQDIVLRPGSSPISCPVPLGLIPVGRRTDLATSLHGSLDFQTALVHFALGSRKHVDVCAVFNKSEHLGWAFNSQYGYGANALSVLPQDRPCSDKRAEAALTKMLGKERLLSYECDVHFITSKNEEVSYPTDGKFCFDGCPVCKEATEKRNRPSITCDQVVELDPLGDSHNSGSVIELKDDSAWKTVKGSFLWVGLYSNACRNELMAPYGMAPAAHLSDGCADLVLVRQCKRKEFLRYLKRHGAASKNHLGFVFVETHRVTGVRFQARQNITWEHRDFNKTEIDYQMGTRQSSASTTASSAFDDQETPVHRRRRQKAAEMVIDDCTDDEDDDDSYRKISAGSKNRSNLRNATSVGNLDMNDNSSSDDNSDTDSDNSPVNGGSRLGSAQTTPVRDKRSKDKGGVDGQVNDTEGKKKGKKKSGLRRLSLFSLKTTEATDIETKTYIKPRMTVSEREKEKRQAKARVKEEKLRRKAEDRLRSSWILDYDPCNDTELEFQVHSNVLEVFGVGPPLEGKQEDVRLPWLPLF